MAQLTATPPALNFANSTAAAQTSTISNGTAPYFLQPTASVSAWGATIAGATVTVTPRPSIDASNHLTGMPPIGLGQGPAPGIPSASIDSPLSSTFNVVDSVGAIVQIQCVVSNV